MHTQLAPTPRQAPPDECAPNRVPPSDCFSQHPHEITSAWQAVRYWVIATTGVPQCLPARWRRPLAGYLLALLVAVATSGITSLVGALVPALDLDGVLLLLGILVIALICGIGPSLLATGIDFLLLASVLLASSFSWWQRPSDWLDLVVLLVSGLGLSLLAGQSGWTRRRAEALACSLRAAKTTSDVERQRLRALVESLPAPVVMVDAQERLVEANAAIRTLWGDPAPIVRAIADGAQVKGRWPSNGQPLDHNSWAITRALRTGERVSNEEVEIETIDGRLKIMLDSATPVRDGHGTIHGAVGVLQDITERKRLEEALRRAEREAAARARELEAIFEALTDGLLVYDAEGRILRCNSAARQLLGFDEDPEFVALPWKERADRYAPTDAKGRPIASVNLAVPRLLRGEVLTGTQTAEDFLHTPDGREIAFSMTGRPLHDTEGIIVGAVAIARDETDRRRLEQQTRDSLDALLEMAEALVQGHEPAEQAAQTLQPGTDPTVGGAGVATRLAKLARRVLDCRSVSIVAVDAQTEALKPVTVVGHSQEVEQRWWAGWKREQERKEAWQPHLRDVLPPDAVARLQAGELVLPERLPAAKRCWQQMCPSVLVPMHVGKALVGVLQVEGENGEDWGAPGDANATEQKGALLRAAARLGALVLERERLLRERTQAQATELALRQTQAQMEAFLATAAHDLRTPVTAVVGYLDLAERQIERLAATVQEARPELASNVDAMRECLDEAGDGADRLTRLLNLLFDTAAMRAGRLELRRAPCDLAQLVREQVATLRVAAPQRSIRLHTRAVSRQPVLVETDGDRIGQVLTNYMTNALKYSPPDQPVDVSVTLNTHQAHVAVRDRGPGLPEAEQTRVWEPFHRAPGVEVQGMARGGINGSSLGLGLHICKAIVEAHGGQVGVESTVGQGSTFWFTLPLAGAHVTAA